MQTSEARQVSVAAKLICVLALLSLTAGVVGAVEKQVLPSRAAKMAAALRPLRPLAGDSNLSLTISLPLRNKPLLTNLLEKLYNPASPRFHRFLTPAEFARDFGPTESDYQAVADFARAQGLTVTHLHPNRTLLNVRGTVKTIERALNIHLRVYQHPTENRTFFAPDTPPAAQVSVPLLGVSGLDNYVVPRPCANYRLITGAETNRAYWGSGTNGTYMGPDFRAAYLPGVTWTGAGQSVGLFELDGYSVTDIRQYETMAGLPDVPLKNVLVDGFDGGTINNSGGQLEVSLDIEMAISIAPGLAQVIVYEGLTPDDVLNRMATDNLAQQLSSSWGWDSFGETTEQIYLQFAAQGQTMFQASGDSGAYVGPVFPPSDEPYATVVGGTTLTTAGPGAAWVSETVWSGFLSGNGSFASGGGVSTVFPLPFWQEGMNLSKCQGSSAMRNIPDVALTADNIQVISQNGQFFYVSGTSCATPLWAGLTALVNQQQAVNGQAPVGFLNPALYALGKGPGYSGLFHDITTGNNTNYGSPVTFFAVPGYDLCTGWGTPNGSNCLNALVTTPDQLRISPATSIVAQGDVGGGFSVPGVTFSLTNSSQRALNWALGCDVSWLGFSATTGPLAPGGPPASVTASFNEAASNLLVGTYYATLWFTNLSDKVVQEREITLVLAAPQPPQIINQPGDLAVTIGKTATFNVTAQGGGSLNYQWLKNGTNLVDDGRIYGSLTSTLNLTNTAVSDIGMYSVLVTNSVGSVLSRGAHLSFYSPLGGANLVQNGGFESGWFANWNQLGYLGNSYVTSSDLTYRHSGSYGAALGETYGNQGLLQQFIPTTPGSAYLVSLWFYTPTNSTPNEFSVFWNGAVSYDATDLFVPGWSNLQFVASATLPNTSLEIGYRNNSFFALDDVSVSLVSLTAPPSIVSQPTDVLVSVGNSATFSVSASGNSPLGYQWQFQDMNLTNGPAVSGANSATLTLSNVTAGNVGSYRVIVTNLYGSAQSAVAQLTLPPAGETAPTLTFDDLPANSTPVPIGYGDLTWVGFLVLNGISQGNGFQNGVVSGNNIIFANYTASITNATPFGFATAYVTAAYNDNLQLQVIGFKYGNQVFNQTYTVNPTSPTFIHFNCLDVTEIDFYSCCGTGHPGYGNGTQFIMDNVTVLLPGAPRITHQPFSQVAPPGTGASFSVAARGSEPLVYQWQKNGVNLVDSGEVSGSAATNLVLNSISVADAGIYTVTVANGFGSAESMGAALSVPDQLLNSTNLVLNSGFETGDLTDWTLSGQTNGSYATSYGPYVHSGRYGAELGNQNAGFGFLSQNLATQPGTDYLVSFWIADQNAGFANQLLLSWNGNLLYSETNLSSSFVNRQLVAHATSVSTLLEFGFEFPGYPNLAIDDISVSPITVLAAPVIITGQPVDQLAALGGTATFSVAASGSDPIYYQWLFNGTNISNGPGVSGAHGPTLTLSQITEASAGLYSVTVSNAYGMATSSGAKLDLPPPGQTLTAATFDDLPDSEVGVAVPQGYMGVSWPGFSVLDGANFPGPSGYHAAVLSASNIIFNVGGQTAILTNPVPFGLVSAYLTAAWLDGLEVNVFGSVGGTTLYSNNYILSVTAPTFIQFNYAGVDNVAFSTSAGTLHPGYTNAGPEFAMDNVTLLTAGPLVPLITTQPASQVRPAGQTVTFSVSASGLEPLTYQWLQNGTNLSDGGTISGSSTANLTLGDVSRANDGVYSVIVSNAYGVAVSSSATLFVYSPVAGASNLVQNGGFETGDFAGWNRAGVTTDNSISSDSRYRHTGTFGAQLGPSLSPGGSLSQSIPTSGGASYLVSLWLDEPDGLSPNHFRVSWNGNVLFDQSNLGTTGWTNLQFVVAGTEGLALLEFDFMDVPSYLGLDDVSVQAVAFAPKIVNQPADEIVAAGQTATLSVGIVGTLPVAYRWQRNGVPLSDDSSVNGSATATLRITNASVSSSAQYSVVVSNPFGSTISSNATLIVFALPPGTTNLVQNGDFETGDFTGWIQSGNDGYWNWWSGYTPEIWVSSGILYAHSGRYGVQLEPVGALGFLSQSLPTIPGATYLVSLWLDSPDGLVPNYFSVSWNGAALFSQADLGATGWTNLGFVVQAASASSLLEIGFEDSTSSLGLDDVKVLGITVGGAPVITRQPVNKVNPSGTTASFSVAATGQSPLGYQWQKNGTNLSDGGFISGSATANLNLSLVSTNDAGLYSVLVSNSYGVVTSSPGTLTILPPGETLLTFDDLPDAQYGDIVPAGYGGLDWLGFSEIDGVSYFGPSGYFVGAVSPNNVVYNNYGETASMVAANPFGLVSASLTAAWNDALQLQARGYRGGTLLYDNTYTLSATVPTLLQFNYTAVDRIDFISFGGTPHAGYDGSGLHFAMDNVLIVPPGGPPRITAQPASQTVAPGSTASFAVSVMGSLPQFYQWLKNETNLLDNGNIFDSTSPTLTISNVTAVDIATYSVMVSNAYGTVTSSGATLSLLPTNGDLITFDDLPDTSGGLSVPDGYAGLNWVNFYELDGLNYGQPSGYGVGVVSSNNVVYNAYGNPASILADGGSFDLLNAYVTAAWNDNLRFEAKGFVGGTLAYDASYTLSTTQRTWINFNFRGVTEINFNAWGGIPNPSYQGSGPFFVMDNLQVSSLNSPPRITSQPGAQLVSTGATVTFSVSASGSSPLSYQWTHNGTNLLDGENVAGVATPNLVVSNVTELDGGSYALLVINAFGTASSAPAELIVYTTVSGAGNLVTNGGFETGDFTAWNLSGNASRMVVSSNSLSVHSGHYGAQLGPIGPLGGFLSQSLPTIPGATYLLSAWLNSPDGFGPNALQIGWDNASLFNQQNLGPIGWTNLQFLVTASTTNTLLTFSARDDTSFFGLDDVSLIAISVGGNQPVAPRFTGQFIDQVNNLVSLKWTAQPGRSYQLQYSPTLNPAIWRNAGVAITATDYQVNGFDALSTNRQGFYRVLVLP